MCCKVSLDELSSYAADAMQSRTWIGKFHHSPTAVQDLPPTARKAQADVSTQYLPFLCFLFLFPCMFPVLAVVPFSAFILLSQV